MFCSKCGNSLTSDAEFCSKCGTKIDQQGAAADGAAAPKQPTAAEKIAEMSAEKWKELSPKAKEAAAAAAEKASAVSKDILGELKQSGAALRQAIDENKGDGSETKAKTIEKTASSFISKLTGKQKVVLISLSALSVLALASALSSGQPEDRCVITGMSALGESGIFPPAKNIQPLQCQLVKEYLAHFKCDTNVYRYMSSNPKKAVMTLTNNPSDSDVTNTKQMSDAVRSACSL